MILAIVVTIYVSAIVAFIAGSWWGRRAALRELASIVEDEACRAALHGDDALAGRLFGLASGFRYGRVPEWEVAP